MLDFTPEETKLIESMDIGRLSTISSSGWPHCVPVGYVFQEGMFHVPTHKQSRRILNLERNSRATILIDKGEIEIGIMIECSSTILAGTDTVEMRAHMRNVKRWQNDEHTAIIKLDPLRKASW